MTYYWIMKIVDIDHITKTLLEDTFYRSTPLLNDGKSSAVKSSIQ
jgi:hypothetical protein